MNKKQKNALRVWDVKKVIASDCAKYEAKHGANAVHPFYMLTLAEALEELKKAEQEI